MAFIGSCPLVSKRGELFDASGTNLRTFKLLVKDNVYLDLVDFEIWEYKPRYIYKKKEELHAPPEFDGQLKKYHLHRKNPLSVYQK